MKARRTATGTVTQYTIVYAQSGEELTKKVEELLAQGWKPQGGVCNASWWFYQAMVR